MNNKWITLVIVWKYATKKGHPRDMQRPCWRKAIDMQRTCKGYAGNITSLNKQSVFMVSMICPIYAQVVPKKLANKASRYSHWMQNLVSNYAY